MATDATPPSEGQEDRAPRGFLLNATGPVYREMALSVGRDLKLHHPDIPIDYYTDVAPEPGLFDRVYMLDELGPRPRFEALRRSRFDRVIMLDVDMVVVAPIDDVFEVLERFDLALAFDQYRNGDGARLAWRKDIPNAFPQFNGGLVGIRKSPATDDFIDRWEAGYTAHGSGVDQPALREILWEDNTLRIATLPHEYNLYDVQRIDTMAVDHTAPRIIHHHLIKAAKTQTNGGREETLDWVLGPHRRAHLEQLIANDITLRRAPNAGLERAPYDMRFNARYTWLRFRDLPRKLSMRAGRFLPWRR